MRQRPPGTGENEPAAPPEPAPAPATVLAPLQTEARIDVTRMAAPFDVPPLGSGQGLPAARYNTLARMVEALRAATPAATPTLPDVASQALAALQTAVSPPVPLAVVLSRSR